MRGRVPHVRRLEKRRPGENLPSPLFVKEGNPGHLDGRQQWQLSWQMSFVPDPTPHQIGTRSRMSNHKNRGHDYAGCNALDRAMNSDTVKVSARRLGSIPLMSNAV